MIPPPPTSTLFPYTTLFRSHCEEAGALLVRSGVPRSIRRGDDRRGEASRPSGTPDRSEEHTSELLSRFDLVCRLLLEKKKKKTTNLTRKEAKIRKVIRHTTV